MKRGWMNTGLSGNGLGVGAEGTDSRAPTEHELFEMLSSRRRRHALQALAATDEIDLGPLAEQVAAWENEKSVAAVTSDERKRVYTSLQQSHLPKLDDAGLVEFDKRSGVVVPSPTLEEYDVYLDVVRGDDIPWNEYYLGLSAVGAAVLTAAAVDAYPFAMLPDVAWGVFVVVAFFVSACCHTYLAPKMHLGGGDGPPEVAE